MASFKKFFKQTVKSISDDPLRAALNIGTFGVYEALDRAGIVDATTNAVTFGATNQMRMQREQQRAMREQGRLTEAATAAAQNQARLNAQEANKANQRRPNLAALMARAAGASRGGVASTALTGVGGVPRKNLRLGETSLLGE